jgi:hypothetical protein
VPHLRRINRRPFGGSVHATIKEKLFEDGATFPHIPSGDVENPPVECPLIPPEVFEPNRTQLGVTGRMCDPLSESA